MSASTALVVSAIAGVVLGMAFVKMPQPMSADFHGQQAPARTTTASLDPVLPVPVTSTSRPPRTPPPTTTVTATTTTTTTTAPTTTTSRPTRTTKPPKPTKTTTTGPSSTTTTTDDGGLLGPILG